MTLRELTMLYDAHLLTTWDHTCVLTAMVHNVASVVSALAGKGKIKPKSPSDFHPYRDKVRGKGMKLTKDNFGTLRTLGRALCMANR